MKRLKTFEMHINKDNEIFYEDKLKKYKFKIGDYVRFHLYIEPKTTVLIKVIQWDILQIFEIDTAEDRRPYHVKLVDNSQRTDTTYWIPEINYELVPDYEISAIKYNL